MAGWLAGWLVGTFEEHAEERTVDVSLTQFVPEDEVFLADLDLDLGELGPVRVLHGVVGDCA